MHLFTIIDYAAKSIDYSKTRTYFGEESFKAI